MEQELLKTYAKQYSAMVSTECETNWLKGDIAQVVWEAYKEEKNKHGRSNVLSEFLEYTNESRSAFNQYKWISSIFEDDGIRNLPGLTWTHYRACAATENPKDWLEKAYDNRWSTARLVNEIQSAKEEKEIEDGVICRQCDKTVTKEERVSLKFKKKRYMLCSITCVIEFCKNYTFEQNVIVTNDRVPI